MQAASDDLVRLAWTQAWQLAALAAAVALVVKLTCRQRPHLAYLLWMLVVVKAVTPPVWSSPTGAFSWALSESVVQQPATTSERLPNAPMPSAMPAAAFTPAPDPLPPAAVPPQIVHSEPIARQVSLASVLLLTWLMGTVVLTLRLALGWFSLLRRLRVTAEPTPPALQQRFAELRSQLGPRRAVNLLVNGEALGPAAMGWWRGTVILPRTLMENSQPGELDAILTHELVHLRRFDPLAGSLQLAVQCLWWWHPAVWWANRQARVERERSCDEAVLAELDCRPVDYARLLVEILQWRQQLVPAVFWSGMRSTAATTARVRHVLQAKAFRRRSPFTAWLITAALLLVVLPGAGWRFTLAAPPPRSAESESSPAARRNESAAPPTLFRSIDGTKVLKAIKIPVEMVPLTRFRSIDGTKAGTLSEAERTTVAQLKALGVHCEQFDYSREFTTWSVYGRGQLHFGTPSVPPGKRQTFVHITLPPDFVPAGPLPLDRLPSLLVVQVGINTVSPMGTLGFLSVPVQPTTEQLRQQLKSLVTLPPQSTLNVVYSNANAAALDALPSITNLQRLALFPNDPSPEGGLSIPLAELKRLEALAWMSEDRAQVAFGAHLPGIAALHDLQTLVLNGKLTEPALDQLASLGKMRSLFLRRFWNTADGRPAPFSLACLSGMPLLQDLTVDIIDDAAAERIGKLANLRTLGASTAALSDAGIRQLARASQLRTLRLSGLEADHQMTSAGLSALGALTRLESLSLADFVIKPLSVTDEALATWDTLASLQLLRIDSAELTDASLRVIGNLAKLRRLQLHGKLNFTDAGLAPLANLTQLGMLILPGATIKGPGLSALTQLPQLEALSLASSSLDDRGMPEIAKISKLRQLDVSHTKITDEGLAALAGKLPLLMRLNLAGTDVSDAGAVGLKDRRRLQEVDVTNTNLTVRFLNQLMQSKRNFALTIRSSISGENPALNGTFQPIELNVATVPLAEEETGKPQEDVSADPDPNSAMIAQLKELGLQVTPVDVRGKSEYVADFEPTFKATEAPLPLENLPNLRSIAINDRRNLTREQFIAQLRAVRKLRPETQLIVFFKPDQGAAFDMLGEIPQLQRLVILSEIPRLATAEDTTGRTLRPGDLPKLRELTLVGAFTDKQLTALAPLAELETLQLYQEEPFASLDLTCLENKPKLKHFATGGITPTDAGFARIGKLAALQVLTTNIDGATNVGIASLANLAELRTLVLDARQGKTRVTPVGLESIGKLSNLTSLVLSGRVSPRAVVTDGGITDQIIASWSPQLKKLKRVALYDCELTDPGLIMLSRLPSLVSLSLFGDVQVTDRGRGALGTMTQLRELYFNDPQLTDAGFALLKGLNSLEKLSLAQAGQLTDAGLAPLGEFKKLKSLAIFSSKLTGSGFASLQGLDGLEKLALGHNPITDTGTAAIVQFMNLRDLDLSGTQISDKSLKMISSHLTKLERLNIGGTKITDEGLAFLSSLKNLRAVVAHGTKITQAAGRKFAVASGANIDWVDSGTLEFSLDVDE